MPRTRVLDIDKAVHTAMLLFWRKGYDATSLADLTAEMEITPPSFYFAFQSKDGLFRKVVDYYATHNLAFMNQALLEPTARKVAETILFGCVHAYTQPGMPSGCLIVNNSMPCADDALQIRHELAQARETRFKQLCKRFREAKKTSDLSSDSDPVELARFLMSLRWGMAIEAQSGASRRDLQKIADRALQAWPASMQRV